MIRPHLLALALLVGLVPLGAHGQISVTAPNLDADELAELGAGEVIVDVDVDGNEVSGTIIGVVDGPVDAVFEIIADFADQDSWIPDMYDAEVVQSGSDVTICAGKTDLPWPLADREYQLEVRNGPSPSHGEQAYSSRWTMVEGIGNMVTNDGFWLVTPFNGDVSRTLVSYRFVADSGIAAPDGMEQSATRRMLPGFITGLRERYDALN
jgi:hypothetical protein